MFLVAACGDGRGTGFAPPTTTVENTTAAAPTLPRVTTQRTTIPPSGIFGKGSFKFTDVDGYTYKVDWQIRIYDARLDVTYSKPGNGVAYFSVDGFVAFTNTTAGRNVVLKPSEIGGISAFTSRDGFDPDDCDRTAKPLSSDTYCSIGAPVHFRVGDQERFDLATGETMQLDLEIEESFPYLEGTLYASESDAQRMVDLINSGEGVAGFVIGRSHVMSGYMCSAFMSATGELQGHDCDD